MLKILFENDLIALSLQYVSPYWLFGCFIMHINRRKFRKTFTYKSHDSSARQTVNV